MRTVADPNLTSVTRRLKSAVSWTCAGHVQSIARLYCRATLITSHSIAHTSATGLIRVRASERARWVHAGLRRPCQADTSSAQIQLSVISPRRYSPRIRSSSQSFISPGRPSTLTSHVPPSRARMALRREKQYCSLTTPRVMPAPASGLARRAASAQHNSWRAGALAPPPPAREPLVLRASEAPRVP